MFGRVFFFKVYKGVMCGWFCRGGLGRFIDNSLVLVRSRVSGVELKSRLRLMVRILGMLEGLGFYVYVFLLFVEILDFCSIIKVGSGM